MSTNSSGGKRLSGSTYNVFSGSSPPAKMLLSGQLILQSVSPKKVTCTNCQQAKPHLEYHRNKRKKNGRDSWCKRCVSKSKSKKYLERKNKRNKGKRKNGKVLYVEDLDIVEITLQKLADEHEIAETLLKRYVLDVILTSGLCEKHKD